jgi:ribosomal protein L11
MSRLQEKEKEMTMKTLANAILMLTSLSIALEGKEKSREKSVNSVNTKKLKQMAERKQNSNNNNNKRKSCGKGGKRW